MRERIRFQIWKQNKLARSGKRSGKLTVVPAGPAVAVALAVVVVEIAIGSRRRSSDGRVRE